MGFMEREHTPAFWRAITPGPFGGSRMAIWIALVVILGVATVAFALQASGRGNELARLEGPPGWARAEAEKARASEKTRTEEAAARKAELTEVKDKLKDAKKKLHDERSAEDRLRSAEHELRAETEKAHLKLQDLL